MLGRITMLAAVTILVSATETTPVLSAAPV